MMRISPHIVDRLTDLLPIPFWCILAISTVEYVWVDSSLYQLPPHLQTCWRQSSSSSSRCHLCSPTKVSAHKDNWRVLHFSCIKTITYEKQQSLDTDAPNAGAPLNSTLILPSRRSRYSTNAPTWDNYLNLINKFSQKPSNKKRISCPSEKQNFPDKKNYIPVPDGSRLSTEIIAPFFQHRMIDSTFVSRLRKKLKTGKMNLNEIGFHLMWILLLKLRSQSQHISWYG